MPYIYTEENPTELMHYGRLGMKWGQHIFGDDPRWGRSGRNAASGLEKSKKNLNYGEGENEPESKPSAKSSPDYSVKALKKSVKKVSKMSDKELDERIARLRKQKEYEDLVKSSTVSESKGAAMDVLKRVLKANGEGIGYAASSVISSKLAKKLVEVANKNGGDNGKNDNLWKDLATILAMNSTYMRNKTQKKKK